MFNNLVFFLLFRPNEQIKGKNAPPQIKNLKIYFDFCHLLFFSEIHFDKDRGRTLYRVDIYAMGILRQKCYT